MLTSAFSSDELITVCFYYFQNLSFYIWEEGGAVADPWKFFEVGVPTLVFKWRFHSQYSSFLLYFVKSFWQRRGSDPGNPPSNPPMRCRWQLYVNLVFLSNIELLILPPICACIYGYSFKHVTNLVVCMHVFSSSLFVCL